MIDEKRREFWSKIEQIKEISLSTGLERVCGQLNVYEKTLKLMLQEIEKLKKNLNEFLAVNDMNNFRIEVHGIKGSLANIGAMELSTQAHDLEVASDRGNTTFCAAMLPLLLEGLTNLSEKLHEAFSVLRQSSGPMEIPPELPSIFEKMKYAFATIDLVLIDNEVENLNALNLRGILKEEIEQITDMVMMMDYDGATEIMQKLLHT